MSDEIRAALQEEEGFEELISDEIFAAEKNKAKSLISLFELQVGQKSFRFT